jgi:hypothetical protein
MLVEKIIDYSRHFYTLLGDRRKAERLDFNCKVTVSCKNRYGSLTTHVCNCLNLSDRGIGLESPEPIPTNCDVYIHSETHNMRRFGLVRWCVQSGDRFFVGCSFKKAPEYWN